MPVTLVRPYTTRAAVQSECRNYDAAEDDAYDTAINDATQWIENFCGRGFWHYDYSGTPLTVPEAWIVEEVIYLPWPVKTLTEITSDAVEISTDNYRWQNPPSGWGTAQVIRNGDYHWDKCYATSRERIILQDSSAPPVIKITGTFGYDDDSDDDTPPLDMPMQISRAATLIAAAFSGLYRRENIGLDGVKSDVMDSRIPQQALDMLRKWRWSAEI